MQAIWKNTTIAESEDTVIVEGNHYFPEDSLNMDYLKESATSTSCPWKGDASYYSVCVDGEENTDAAWCYRNPTQLAEHIKNHIAFCDDVKIVD